MVVREAFGFAEPHPEDPVHDDEFSVVPLIQLQLSQGVSARGHRAVASGYGDSLRRIAETEADWWNTEVERRCWRRA